jgi:hypothetical protein
MINCKTSLVLGLPVILAVMLLSGMVDAWAQTTKATGTQQMFNASQTQVGNAVSNAFKSYKGMALFSAQTDGFIPGWHKTNGWILFPLDGPITTTPWKNSKELVPYIPTFHISLQPTGTNRTTITVRTIDARVIHGKEIGVHGGMANHEVNVPPVRSEETNVLTAISNAVALLTGRERATP